MDPLWADLINSRCRDYRGSGEEEDRLYNDSWLGRFLRRAGCDDERLPGSAEREKLARLRRLLTEIVGRVMGGEGPSGQQVEALNSILASAPVLRQCVLSEGAVDLRYEPASSGIAGVSGAVVASFVEMLARGEPERIKICANPDCAWVMYDESRNRSRRWCDKTECGNLIKVRQHRQRKKRG